MSTSASIRDRARITVKIHNMKRSASRAPGDRCDSPPPRVKRIRTSMDRFDHVPENRHSPDRRRLRSKSVHAQYVTPSHSTHRDEFALAVIPREPSAPPRAPQPPPPQERSHTFKVLCISSLHPKASDEYVKDTLYREFKRFGDFSIRIGRDHDERVAYLCFRSSEVAREAKRQKQRVVIYDKPAMITVVYERPENKYKVRRSISPEYERSYYQPPVTERRRTPAVDPYNRYAPHPPIHREYRPPMNHHDYMSPRGPIIHHPPHVHQTNHHFVTRHTIRHPPPPHESKKDKFPNYLHHVQPEDDPQATRTLFAGNLEVNISEEELRRIFGKFGHLDDIDIKRPNPGAGNAFAFVRFENLDMAHRAKIELSGQYIGKFQCKIGYGKANPTSRIWIGGLGAWTSLAQLEREFDRFGAIKKIEYKKGDSCAYIWYESIEAAQAAVKAMRGYALGGPERRLRMDFSSVPNGHTIKPKSPGPAPTPAPAAPEPNSVHREAPQYDGYASRGAYRGRGRGRGVFRGGYQQYEPQRKVNEDERSRPLLAIEYEPASNSNSSTPVTNNSVKAPSVNDVRSTPVNNVRAPSVNNVRSTPVNNVRAPSVNNVRSTPVNNVRAPSVNNVRSTPVNNVRSTPVNNVRSTPVNNVRSTPVRSTPVRSTPVSSTSVRSTPVKSTPVSSTSIRSTPVRSTPVSSTSIRSTPVRSTSVSITSIRSTPVNNVRSTPVNNFRSTPVNNVRSTPINNVRSTPIIRANRSQSRVRSPGPHTPDSEPDANTSPAELLGSAVTLADVARKSVSGWTGSMILKNSLFPTKLHLTDGDDDIAPILMKDEKGSHDLRITQRLRMDPPKLNEVEKRIRTAKSYAIYVALPRTDPIVVHDNNIQTRPLRNLVSYLKQKQAAGVLPLLQKSAQTSGVLYAFPPCPFSTGLLKRTCHNLSDETLKGEYLVVVVVRGASVPSL